MTVNTVQVACVASVPVQRASCVNWSESKKLTKQGVVRGGGNVCLQTPQF